MPKIYLLLPLYINRSITKKFLIKTLLKVIDSTSPGLLTLESIISKSVSIRNFFVMDQFMYSSKRDVDLTSNFSAKLDFFDDVASFAYHIRFLQDF